MGGSPLDGTAIWVYEMCARLAEERLQAGGCLVMYHIGTSIMQWLTSLMALVLAALHTVPHHSTQHHHQPVRLPELASAGPV